MKKKWLAVIGVVILVSIFATAALASNPIKLFVNGQEIKPDVPPQIINGRTMVPIRWVAEALGTDVQWDIDSQTVKITTKEKIADEIPYLGMRYIEPEYQVRFVENELDLLFLPYDNARVQRKIMPNTLVQVNDLVEVENECWLYVTVPVYDTPMNMKGWIKESDTVPFTKDKERKVQSDVTIKAGTLIYEVWCYFSRYSFTV